MLKKNVITIVLIFTALSLLSLPQTTHALWPSNKPLSFGDPKLPPPKQQPARLPAGEQYKLNCANQQLQQSMNNLAHTGYNIGATLAILSKK